MPKMKTHKGAAKRFRKTGTGKLKRAKALELRNKVDLTIKEETKVNTIPKRKSIFKKGVF